MAQEKEEAERSENKTTLEAGTYEIIRNRLSSKGKDLKKKLDRLNTSRKDIFGSIESKLIATERISTKNNCLPRDMVSVNGKKFLFGYNVHMGLRSETTISDVLAVYEYQDHAFKELTLDTLSNGNFQDDFKELYKYYKETRFIKFSIIGPHLFMVFQTGKTVHDFKTFKWDVSNNKLKYIGNRSDHEFRYPVQFDFNWKRTNRDMHIAGEHPHVSIDDRVFVEAVGGDITFKVEDNTDSGMGIYEEKVDHKDQTLDDAEIHYAPIGDLILVKIKPYQENKTRHFIFNEKIQKVYRVDEIENSCVLLPDDHGLIFSNGYYLQTGELKQFDSGLTNMIFEGKIVSANGEDIQYVFYNQDKGDYILLPYNIINQKVENPVICNGFSIFDNGEMLVFRSTKKPEKHHAIQIWQSPYVSSEFSLTATNDSYLSKIGNPDIVRCMAECTELYKKVTKEDIYDDLYTDIVKKSVDISDTYFWLDKDEAFHLKDVILSIKEIANNAINEFEKVVRLKKKAEKELKSISHSVTDLIRKSAHDHIENINQFVDLLSSLRTKRGDLISLKELRYMDLDAVDLLDGKIQIETDKISEHCVDFLLTPESLLPYKKSVSDIEKEIHSLEKVTDAEKTEKEIAQTSTELEMLIDIVSNLKIEDSTQTTSIINNISDIYSSLNKVRAGIKSKKKELLSVEGVAQFNSQIKLLNQSIVNYLDICDTPEKCDEYLTKLMVQVEELEGKFSEFDDYIDKLVEKREELYSTFESKKSYLLETRNKKADSLKKSAERILNGIKNKVSTFEDINTINGYFASDLMVEKIRNIISKLNSLKDTVKADDLNGQLKTLKEDTVRQLKDKKELFVDGKNIIRFGEHHFSVNTQNLDLTIVRRDRNQYFHLTGTDFFEHIINESFNSTTPVWDMEVRSENKEVYRSEYLAYLMLKSLSELKYLEEISDFLKQDELSADHFKQLLKYTTEFMGPRYDEAYSKGVHDHDATKIFYSLARTHQKIGLLRFNPVERSFARFFWHIYFQDKNMIDLKKRISIKFSSLGKMHKLIPDHIKNQKYIMELKCLMDDMLTGIDSFPDTMSLNASKYLFYELIVCKDPKKIQFSTSSVASDLFNDFKRFLTSKRSKETFEKTRKFLSESPADELSIIREWVASFINTMENPELSDYTDEVSMLIFENRAILSQDITDISLSEKINDLSGDHKCLENGCYHLNYNRFMSKLKNFEEEIIPRFDTYTLMKKELTDKKRMKLRLSEFKPRILSSFVRNKLINKIYLPLVGDNLAKQIGTTGENKRTDLMGLLLVVSPPGYGKTTLMEYIANRLGIIFIKINGPAIGHSVTSLDPEEAKFASAREEVKKLNLAFEMGDNIMIYLDDIQHLNPEFLQKFISLCDGQRKIEGVYNGISKTYDLRGKKVVVVMAGNPYTESGEKFKIPDMLANRADTYNLGDIIGDSEDVFKMSYLENSLTSNKVLSQLSSKSQEDIYSIIKIAETGLREGVEFDSSYSNEEVDEMVSVMKKMIVIREIILKVNQEYIYSASQSDEYRTEPPFKLQGSYRNMNRLAEKIYPVMNEEELKTLILSHYENEAQTLTSGTEANLLKFREMTSWMSDDEKRRWEDIKKKFQKNQLFHGTDKNDPASQVVAQLSGFNDGLDRIQVALSSGLTKSEKTHVKKEVDYSQVVNQPAVTDDFVKIINSQIDLMNSWMEPVFEETGKQSKKINSIIKNMKTLGNMYKGAIREKGNFDEGLIYYNKALELNSMDDEAFFNRGVIWFNKKDFGRALSDVKNALSINPKSRRYQHFLSFLKREMTAVEKSP